MPDRYPARIDRFDLEIQDITDTFEKSIARYELPYTDGAILEDMGQKARTIRFRCYFYKTTYELHKQFLNLLKTKTNEILSFSHPKYGLLGGYFESISVRHDDTEETAEIDVTFIEHLRRDIETTVFVDVETKCEDIYKKSVEEQKQKFADDIKTELGQSAEGILSKELDDAQGILEQFTGLTRQAREYVKRVDVFERGLNSTLNEIANPANSLIATIEFGVDLPGRIIGAAARTVERYGILLDNLISAPTRFIQSFSDGMTQLENALGFQSHTRIAGARHAGLSLGYMYSTDENNRQTARRLEKVKSFDASGKYVKSEAMPALLTVNEIEQSLYDVRAMLLECIEADRALQSLKDMALTLQEHAYAVKIESEKLIPVEIDNEIPLHLVCLMYGLSYQYAERIHSVNKIKHPNFTRGDIRVYFSNTGGRSL